jgi:hypothetical protein
MSISRRTQEAAKGLKGAARWGWSQNSSKQSDKYEGLNKLAPTFSIDFAPEISQPWRLTSQTHMGKTFFLGLLAVGATIFSARGDIIPNLSPVPPAAAVGGFTWNYAANVTGDQMVTHGDFFTIYDFGNFASGSNLQPTGWAFSSSLVGTSPSLVLPVDNPSILNLTWTYTGTTPINGSALLGDFSVIASTNQLKDSDFAAEATRNSGPNAGTKIDNVGRVSVPVPEMSALLPILSICGAGLAASIPSFLRRRKTS